jgi:hypothetical protein
MTVVCREKSALCLFSLDLVTTSHFGVVKFFVPIRESEHGSGENIRFTLHL